MYQAKDFTVDMLEPGQVKKVYVSHITDPDNFYIQLASSMDNLDRISTYLEKRYESKTGEERMWHLGDPCAAVYEGQWSRGRVTDTPHNRDLVEVTFVDYGNKDFLRKEEIFPLTPEMMSIPVLSQHCCLEGFSSPENCSSPNVIEKFQNLFMDKELTANVVSYDELQDVYHLLLFDEEDLLNKQFAEETKSDFVENASVCNGTEQNAAAAKVAQAKPNRGIAHALGRGLPDRGKGQNQLPQIQMKVGDKANVSVTYVSSPSEWWCNLTSYNNACDDMTEKMEATYNKMGPNVGLLHNLRPGVLCAAFVEVDKVWYRACVEKVMGPSVLLTFLDYGNTDLVVVGNIKELKEQFRIVPMQAVRCCLHDVSPVSGPWTDDAANIFEKLVMFKDYTATVVAKDPMGRLHMSLMDCSDNSDVATSFLKSRPDARRGSPPSISPERDLPKFLALDIQMHSKAEVFLSWVKTPGDFSVQLAENQTVFDTFANDIVEFYTSSRAESAVGVQIGSMVAAKYSEDGEWYRAVVKNMSETTSEVEFVDYGNSDRVPTVSLQTLTEEFAAIPAQAVRCSLPAIRPLSQGSTWSRDAKQFLESLTDSGALCTFLGRKGDTYEVDLQVDGRSVAQEMMAAAVVRESSPMASSSKVQKYRYVEAPGGQSHQAYVAFVNSVESFYLQLLADITDLEQLMEEMQDFYEAGKGKSIANCIIGLPCAAKYEVDGQWYRAEVRSFTVRDVDVFFVDYGNTQSSPKHSIFQMEPDFVGRVHAQAIHCQLEIPESRNAAEAQLENFNAFTEDEELELVIKAKEGSKLLVDLKKEGVSLTDQLKGVHTSKATVEKSTSGCYTPGTVSPGQTVSAFASFIESPARFWVQLAGCDDELTSMMETLSDHYGSGAELPLNNPSPDQPCVALYDVDKQWYRASVMSVHGMEIKVQFVDYGNMELVDRQNIKSISAVFMSSPLLAVECCLDGFQSSFMSDDAVQVMEELMREQELSITFNGPKNVTVKVGNVDIAQALQERGLGPPVHKSAVQVKTPLPQSSSQQSKARDSGISGSPEGLTIKYKEPVPPSGSAEAIITHIDEKRGIIYLQLLSSESQLEQLSSKLQTLYNSGGSPLPGFPVNGQACCAKYQEDNCWYRALVEQISGNQVQVQFVDYGNSDTVPVNSLKSISSNLAASPKHAFICKLKGLKTWTAQSYKALCRYAMDEQLNIRFVTSSSPFEIQVSVKGQDLLQTMFKSSTSPAQPSYDRFNSRERDSQQRAPQPARNQGFGGGSSPSSGLSGNRPPKQSFRPQVAAGDEKIVNNKPSARSPMKVEVVEQVFQTQKTPSGEQETYVSHVTEDGSFYVQLVKDIAVIDEMTNKVENCPPAPHPSPRVGAACGAQYSDDGAWYRGQIQSVSGSSVVVVFIDFGNSETCEVRTLKPLPAALLTPPLAFHCQATVGALTAEQQETFRAASGDKEYRITFRGGVPYDVIVKDEDGTDLATTIFRPTTVPQPKVPSQKVHAVVSHVGQDGHFYLQLNNDLDPIADFREEVQTVCEGLTEKLDSFDQGQVCLAQFSDDDAWYRASVVSSSGDEVSVLFLDYGNSETVEKNSLLILPPSLMARPAWAYNCKIPGVKKWREGQKLKFEAMTDGKTMNACFLSSKQQPYDVELTIDIGLELVEDEYSEETTENDIPEVEVAEKAEFNQDKEAAEESEEKFEVAEEPAEDEESVEQPADNPDESPKSAPQKQEPAETGGSEEEFSDAQESPEDSAPPAEDGEGRRPSEDGSPSKDRSSSETSIPAFPAQTPPALDACIVSHVISDGTFYLQLLSEDDSREKMSDTLQDECQSVDCKSIVRPLVNLACCARFSHDGAWYRATVEKVDGEMVEVLFVDLGNTDCMPAGDLRELSVDSLKVPPLAYKCVLEDCDTELVGSKLEETTTDQTLTVTFSTTETIPYSVNLQLESGVNVSTMLVKPSEQPSNQSITSEETEASRDNVSVISSQDRKCVALERGQRVKVTVSHVISPSLFYVQRDDTSAQLEEIADAMFDHYSSLAEEDGVIENLSVDQLCVGQFGEEGSWYRAVVRSINSELDTCSLFYVDYGNRDTVPRSSVRELLADFEALPWQCVSCSLAGVSCQGDWSDQVNTAFEDMVDSKSVTAEILSGNGVDEAYSAHVFDEDKSVTESLLALDLPGVEVAEMSSPPSSEPAAAAESESPSTTDLALDNPSQEVVESGLVEEGKEEDAINRTVEDFDESEQDFSRHLHECPAQETVDDLDESEQEFSRQLKACTARMESTMMEEGRSARQGLNSTHGGELSGMSSREEQGGKEEEEEEDFEDAVEAEQDSDAVEAEQDSDAVEAEQDSDAVEAEQDSDAEDGNASSDLQFACSCVSDGLAELEWLDIHVCVAVVASEFWCQLPSACSILSATSLGIERARASQVVKHAKVGNLYLVCDPPHTNYRGKVLSDCDDEGRVLVLKLDYGTEERVPTRCLHPLAKHQLELPAQAFCCCLGDDDEVSATPQWLNDLITSGEAVDSELQVKIVGRKVTGTLLVDVRERPGSLSLKASSSEAEAACAEGSTGQQEEEVPEGVECSMETVLEISHSQPVLQSTILGDTMSQSRMESSEGDREYIAHLLEDDKDYEVTVVPGGRPDSFYIIKTSAKGLLEALADDIEEEVKEKAHCPAEGESMTVNTPCLVLDDQTSKWLRGQVKSSGDELKVLCVDRGVELEVGKEGVRELPLRLLDTPTQAVLCSLAHVTPVDGHWCEGALDLFTDFISKGPLKLSSCGSEQSGFLVKLCEESGDEGDLSTQAPESSINGALVEVGYAEAVQGSPLELVLQVERTINDPDTVEELETSFTVLSLLRRNSLELDSDADDSTEQDRDGLTASGDAPNVATESDEEAGCRVVGDGETGGLSDDYQTDNSSMVTMCEAAEELGEEAMQGVAGCVVGAESGSDSDDRSSDYVSADELGEEAVEDADMLGGSEAAPVSSVNIHTVCLDADTAGGVMSGGSEAAPVSSVNIHTVCLGADDVPAVGVGSSPEGSGSGSSAMQAVDELSGVSVDPVCTCDSDPVQGTGISSSVQGAGVGNEGGTCEPKVEGGGNFLDLSWGRVEIELGERGQKLSEFQEEHTDMDVPAEFQEKEERTGTDVAIDETNPWECPLPPSPEEVNVPVDEKNPWKCQSPSSPEDVKDAWECSLPPSPDQEDKKKLELVEETEIAEEFEDGQLPSSPEDVKDAWECSLPPSPDQENKKKLELVEETEIAEEFEDGDDKQAIAGRPESDIVGAEVETSLHKSEQDMESVELEDLGERGPPRADSIGGGQGSPLEQGTDVKMTEGRPHTPTASDSEPRVEEDAGGEILLKEVGSSLDSQADATGEDRDSTTDMGTEEPDAENKADEEDLGQVNVDREMDKENLDTAGKANENQEHIGEGDKPEDSLDQVLDGQSRGEEKRNEEGSSELKKLDDIPSTEQSDDTGEKNVHGTLEHQVQSPCPGTLSEQLSHHQDKDDTCLRTSAVQAQSANPHQTGSTAEKLTWQVADSESLMSSMPTEGSDTAVMSETQVWQEAGTSSYPGTSEHLFHSPEKGSDQPSPAWEVDPLECPLPGTSGEGLDTAPMMADTQVWKADEGLDTAPMMADTQGWKADEGLDAAPMMADTQGWKADEGLDAAPMMADTQGWKADEGLDAAPMMVDTQGWKADEGLDAAPMMADTQGWKADEGLDAAPMMADTQVWKADADREVSLSAEGLDLLTLDEEEELAFILESTAVMELEKQLDEEAEEQQQELSQMIEDYTLFPDLDGEEAGGDTGDLMGSQQSEWDSAQPGKELSEDDLPSSPEPVHKYLPPSASLPDYLGTVSQYSRVDYDESFEVENESSDCDTEEEMTLDDILAQGSNAVENSEVTELAEVKIGDSGDQTGDQIDEQGDQTGEKGDQTGEKGDQTGEKGDQTGEQDDQTGDSGDQTGEQDDQTGEKGDQTGEQDDQTGEQDDQTGDSGDQTGEQDDQTGEKGDQTGEQDDQTGEQDDQTGDSGDQIGEQDDQTGDSGDQTGEKGDQTGEQDDQTGEQDDQTGDSGDQTGEQDDQIGEQDDQTGEQDDQTGDSGDQIGEQDDQIGEHDDQIGEQDDQTGDSGDQIGEQDDHTGEQDDQTGDSGDQIGEQDDQTGDQIGDSGDQTGEQDDQIGDSGDQIGEQDKQTGEQDDQTGEQDDQIGEQDDQIGEQDKQTGDSGDRTSEQGDHTGEQDKQTGDSGDRTSEQGDHTVDSDQTGEQDDLTGEQGDHTGEQDKQPGDSGDQTGDSGDQIGEQDDQTGDSGDHTGEQDKQTGDSGDQIGEQDDQTGDSGDQIGEQDDQTGDSGD